jgi:23S rRNA (adenine2503-C2)-methyltransferase
MNDGSVVEAVLLEDGCGRRTACLSSQAGCRMGCVFCKTGALGFSRNLDAAEIMEQYYHLYAWCMEQGDENVSNIVFMGMGEPLLNLSALRKVCSILSGDGADDTPAEAHQCFSKKRLTVSTCGLAEKIRDMAAEGPDIRLAVSITTAREELRRRLMPASSPLAEIKDALLFYKKRRGRRITLELPLFEGLNTRNADAAALAVFAAGLDVIVNLIPWNPVAGIRFEGSPLVRPQQTTVERFRRELERRGLKTSLRLSKGAAIEGACGQLGMVLHEG